MEIIQHIITYTAGYTVEQLKFHVLQLMMKFEDMQVTVLGIYVT